MKDKPAFPVVENQFNPLNNSVEIVAIHQGMTLRDWFAGMALTGILSNNEFPSWDLAAQQAYNAADAMLKEKEKREANQNQKTSERKE